MSTFMTDSGVEHYSYDFPELVRDPHDNYFKQLRSEGLDPDGVLKKLFGMDMAVLGVHEAISDRLAYVAPERRAGHRVAIELQDQVSAHGFSGDEATACVRKALDISSGRMRPNEAWEALLDNRGHNL